MPVRAPISIATTVDFRGWYCRALPSEAPALDYALGEGGNAIYLASLRTPVVARRFWAGEANDLTRIRENCRVGFSLRNALSTLAPRALARPRRVEIGSLLFP